MKVEWKRFDKNDQKTWPEHDAVVWVASKYGMSLVVIHTQYPGQIYFYPFGVGGNDAECETNEWICKYWAPADLPELPEFPL